VNELQKKYDELAAILVRTSEDYRDVTIKEFCKEHGIPVKKMPRHRVDKNSEPSLFPDR
jgi:spore coat polysaccharide biosynthesis protein SpsF (cytidylyltransferase family)